MFFLCVHVFIWLCVCVCVRVCVVGGGIGCREAVRAEVCLSEKQGTGPRICSCPLCALSELENVYLHTHAHTKACLLLCCLNNTWGFRWATHCDRREGMFVSLFMYVVHSIISNRPVAVHQSTYYVSQALVCTWWQHVHPTFVINAPSSNTMDAPVTTPLPPIHVYLYIVDPA